MSTIKPTARANTMYRVEVKSSPPLVREWFARDRNHAQRKMEQYLNLHAPHLRGHQIVVTQIGQAPPLFAMENK